MSLTAGPERGSPGIRESGLTKPLQSVTTCLSFSIHQYFQSWSINRAIKVTKAVIHLILIMQIINIVITRLTRMTDSHISAVT